MAAAAAAATCWLWMCGHVWLGSPGEKGVGVALMMMMMMLASRENGRTIPQCSQPPPQAHCTAPGEVMRL